MDLFTATRVYFDGEKHLGFFLCAYGVAVLAFCFWLWRSQSGAFAWALVIPLALLGLGTALGGTFFVRKTVAQVAAIEAELKASPTESVQKERARMVKVNANWPRLKMTWGVIALLAMVLILVVKRDAAAGVGLALLFITTTLFFVDVFAERRAMIYTAALERAN